MDEHGFQFRTAAIGGFQKQDVMAYLERSAKEHAQRLAQLQKQLEEARTARTAGDEQRLAETQRVSELEEENRKLTDDLAERETVLAKALAELEELRAKAAELETQVAKLTPAATAYEAVKERAANIELDAHSRAQAIERESREKVKKSEEQVRQWLARTKTAYEKLRGEMTDSLAQAVRGLEQTTQTLEGLDKELEAIESEIADADGVKPPEPLNVRELW